MEVGFPRPLWVRYSLRHGGATEDFVRGVRKLSEITIRLRHQNEKTSKGYLQDAAGLALMKGLPTRVIDRIEAAGGAKGLLLLIVEQLDIIDTKENWYLSLVANWED